MEELEEYRPVKGFEHYFVSNKGNVINIRTGKHLSPGVNKRGYPAVVLSKKGNKKSLKVHTLVLSAFLKKTAETVNHMDGDKLNYDLSNLEWATYKENIDHSIQTGLRTYKGKAILQLDLAGNFIKEWENTYDVQRALGFKQSNISACASGNRNTAYGYKWKYK
jgi:hypothetical protein